MRDEASSLRSGYRAQCLSSKTSSSLYDQMERDESDLCQRRHTHSSRTLLDRDGGWAWNSSPKISLEVQETFYRRAATKGVQMEPVPVADASRRATWSVPQRAGA